MPEAGWFCAKKGIGGHEWHRPADAAPDVRICGYCGAGARVVYRPREPKKPRR